VLTGDISCNGLGSTRQKDVYDVGSGPRPEAQMGLEH
jgi:hypothetical protein